VQGLVNIFKHTHKEMPLKLNAYVTAGLPRVFNLVSLTKPIAAKKEIHERIYKGLCKSTHYNAENN
jgi:hypothetical protein